MTPREQLIAAGVLRPGRRTPNGEMLPDPELNVPVLRLDHLGRREAAREIAHRWAPTREAP